MKTTTHKPIKVLIELPTWLGDAIMATPAIENIVKHYVNLDITLIGSYVATEALKNNPNVSNIIVLDKKIKSLIKAYKKLGKFDIFFTFRSSFRANLLKLFVKSSKKYQFKNRKYKNRHQVKKYVDYINDSLNIKFPNGDLNIHYGLKSKSKNSKLVGINPGASYGSAKRWYPEKFAETAKELSKTFNIIIFGGVTETDFAKIIETKLIENNIKNFKNVAGKTSVSELIELIAKLDILITGDSGPMHIAASLKIPTIAIFGPTNDDETSQWKNPNHVVIKKNLSCQPCMKKTCPLKHHNCMKLIEPKDIVRSVATIYQQ